MVEYITKPFNEMSALELYHILKLRNEIFVVEQDCAYQDIDGKDQESYHLMCYVDGNLAGYTRILPAGLSYSEVSIGRVAIASAYRGNGFGKKLMEKSIAVCNELFKDSTIRIGAQEYLLNFYNSLGFVQSGEPYDEDGIIHIEMVKK